MLGHCLTLEFSKLKINCDWRIAVRLPTVLSQAINFGPTKLNFGPTKIRFCAILAQGYNNLDTLLNVYQDRQK